MMSGHLPDLRAIRQTQKIFTNKNRYKSALSVCHKNWNTDDTDRTDGCGLNQWKSVRSALSVFQKNDGTQMTQIRRMVTDRIRGNPFNPRYPCSIKIMEYR